MFDLFVILSRYFFIAYILFFLWISARYLADERNGVYENRRSFITLQRITIIFMHITAFLVLIASGGGIKALGFGSMSLAVIAGGSFLSDVFYRKSCPLIWNATFFLLDTGIIMLYRLNPSLAERQIMWIMLGYGVSLLVPLVMKLFKRFEIFEILYIICCYALIAVTFLIGSEEFGSINWIYLGGISFQPSEAVKFFFVFYLASAFRKKPSIKKILRTGLLSAGFIFLLVLQRDLGGALIFFITFMIMSYAATSSEALFFSGMGAAAIASFAAYKLFSHVRVRVLAWQNPWQDIDSGGYQIVQSLFAIGTGGFLGSGLTRGMPSSIPVVERDLIFSAICEELGGIFGIGVIFIFIIIFLRGIYIASDCKSPQNTFLALGIVSIMAFQTFLIIGGSIKLIPLTGVTLPFISYGGSSVVVSIIMLGLLQWCMSDKGEPLDEYDSNIEEDEQDEINEQESEEDLSYE